MTSQSSSTYTGAVVVGLDGSGHSERALEWAAVEAGRQHRRLVLLHSAAILPARQAVGLSPMGGGVDPHLIVQAVHDAAQAFLNDRVLYARDRWPDLDVAGALTQLDPREALVEAAMSAHLVVLGSRGRGPVTSMLGSVSVWTSKRAACPVVICRPVGATAERRGVLVGVDGTAANAPAVEMAFQLASERDGDLTVLHCVYEVGGVSRDLDLWEDEAQRLVSESVAGLREKYPDVNAKLRVAVGLVDDTLANASSHYELLVLGRPAPHQTHLFHFSTTTAVLERSTTTVVVVPNPVETPGGPL
ncbi:universal stress protein [Nocardioides bigeumensis]|uniref:Universal stress protein n=1 Tax=Nocardioides bigeumensis TaxID=433657 RepID=A0ABN2Y3V9_9ACTN